METVQKKVLKGRKVTGPKTTDELLYLTWLSDAQRVKVSFRTRVNDGAFTKTTIKNGGPVALPPPPRKDGGKEKRAFFPPPRRATSRRRTASASASSWAWRTSTTSRGSSS